VPGKVFSREWGIRLLMISEEDRNKLANIFPNEKGVPVTFAE